MGFGVSGLGFLVSGFGFLVSGFVFRVSCLGFGVSGFGIRVPGFGSRVPHFCQGVVLKLRTAPLDTALSPKILRVSRRGAQAMYKRGLGFRVYPMAQNAHRDAVERRHMVHSLLLV